MSSKRYADMAAIQEAIDTGIAKRVDDNLYRSQVATELAARGQFANDENIDATIKAADEKQAEEDELANADQQLELKRQSLVKQNLRKAGRGGLQAVNSFKNGVGRVPMPTGLWVPFLFWFVLFMLLVKVNGNSRMGWLWLVITGDAALPDSIASNGANGTITTTTNSDGSVTGSGDFGNGTGTGSGGPPVTMYTPTGMYPLEMDEW